MLDFSKIIHIFVSNFNLIIIMKRLFLLFLILISTGIAANAQLRFGVKGGANLATMNDSEAKIRVAPNLGVLGQYSFPGSGVAVQFEVLYSAQGATAKEDGYSFTAAYDYINIPVLMQYYVAPGLNLEFGPHVGFLTSAKLKASESGVSATVDVKDECNTVDYGLNFGAAYELPSLPLGFFARYSLGLGDVIKDMGHSSNNNRVIQIGAFYRF